MFEVFWVHMGQYRLIFCENESYINYLAIGINVGHISAQEAHPTNPRAASVPFGCRGAAFGSLWGALGLPLAVLWGPFGRLGAPLGPTEPHWVPGPVLGPRER